MGPGQLGQLAKDYSRQESLTCSQAPHLPPSASNLPGFRNPIAKSILRLFVRGEEVDQWSEQALGALLDDGFRIGVTQGYIYSGPIKALQSDSQYSDQFIEAPIGELNLHALLDYHIDGFLEDPFVVAAIQRRRSGSSEIDSLDLDFGSGEVHLLFSSRKRASGPGSTVQ